MKFRLHPKFFRIGGQDYRVIEKHPVILGLTHEGNRVITITGSADLTMEIPCARCLTPVATPFQLEFDLQIDLNLSEEEREEKKRTLRLWRETSSMWKNWFVMSS